MDRTEFYKVITVEGVPERDFLYDNISKFVMKRQVDYYRVTAEDIGRPDMISWKNYGTVQLWWLIMTVNQIYNPLLDLVVGQVLTIPNILDIQEFYTEYATAS